MFSLCRAGIAARIPRTTRSGCAYYSSSFSSGFSSTINTKEPTLGPLGDAMAGSIKVTPRILKQHLDRFVVGQDRSKRVLATAIYHHYQRLQQIRRREEEEREEELYRQRQEMEQQAVEGEIPVLGGGGGGIGGIGVDKRVDDFQGKRGLRSTPERSRAEQDLFEDDSPLAIEKSNVLCLGPTGVGKTLMVRTLAKILDVPFSMSDCTPFTMAGYVGEDVDQAVHRLLTAANYDVRRAESGIICLDEFDKIAKPKSTHGTKDISGEGVQQALLKIVEGTTLQIHTKPERRPAPIGFSHSPSSPGSFNPSNPGMAGGGTGGGSQKGETVTVDTSSILFIFTGAFIGLEKIITDRVAKGSMGFNAHVRGAHEHGQQTDENLGEQPDMSVIPRKTNILDLTEPADLISFGIIPEMVGRIPVTTAVEALNEEMLVRVLTEPRNALLRQYEQLFQLGGVELRFTSPALREIANFALGMGTGARGLRTVVERLLSDSMFETPGTAVKHVLVTASVAKKKNPPFYFARGQQHKFQTMFSLEEDGWVSTGHKSTVSAPTRFEEAAVADSQRAAGGYV